jgi:hypothetical protein
MPPKLVPTEKNIDTSYEKIKKSIRRQTILLRYHRTNSYVCDGNKTAGQGAT